MLVLRLVPTSTHPRPTTPRGAPAKALSGQMIIFETVFALIYGFAYEARWPHSLELLAALLLLAGVTLSARRHA